MRPSQCFIRDGVTMADLRGFIRDAIRDDPYSPFPLFRGKVRMGVGYFRRHIRTRSTPITAFPLPGGRGSSESMKISRIDYEALH